MRIAYIAPYQGRDLLKKRPSEYNLSLAARVKIQLIAELLQKSSHQVDIISQGAVDRCKLRFYPAFAETELFHPAIPVHYVSALPVRFLTGFWEGLGAQRLLKAWHNKHPYDAVIIYSLSNAQVSCAQYAIRRLGIPVILEYEDDAFVDVHGKPGTGLGSERDKRAGLLSRYHYTVFRKLFHAVSGVIAPSPYLLSQVPQSVGKILLRTVVSGEILKRRSNQTEPKKNWVVFSGTHEGTQGLEQMIKAWRILQMPGWELHIAGQGPLTPALQQMSEGDQSIIFHGLLNREEVAKLLCAAKIGMNAQDVTAVPGNVFAFKIVEYLAAGAHVITTPRGTLEPDLEAGITYIPDNSVETIVQCLRDTIMNSRYKQSAEEAAVQRYGPATVSKSLNDLLTQVTSPDAR